MALIFTSMKDLTVGKERKLILAFAVPMLFGQVFQLMFQVVDSAIVGQFVGKTALAAIGPSFPIIFAVISLTVLAVLLLSLSWALADTSPPLEEWSRTFGGSEADQGFSVQETRDGGYIIVGFTYSFGVGGCDVYLVKTDSQGLEEWSTNRIIPIRLIPQQ